MYEEKIKFLKSNNNNNDNKSVKKRSVGYVHTQSNNYWL